MHVSYKTVVFKNMPNC